MRVTFSQLDDFLEELAHDAKRGRIWQNEVFVRIDRAPEQYPPITFRMSIWGTAIVQTPDQAEYILEYGADCGSDDHKNPDGGTDESNRQRAAIVKVAAENGLEVRRGKLEIV